MKMFHNIIGLLFWIICCCLATSSNYKGIIPYKFGYGVNNLYSGDAKEHKEITSENGRTEGEYRWLQPNGLYRVVRYYVDGASGFIAEVTEEEEPRLKNYMFSNLGGGKSNILSGSHSQHSFSYQDRKGTSFSPYGQSLSIGQSARRPSLQYNAPQAQNIREAFVGASSQTSFLPVQQNLLVSGGAQTFHANQINQVQSEYKPPTQIGQEVVNFAQEQSIPITNLLESSPVNYQESSYNIINQQIGKGLAPTQNIITNQQSNHFSQDDKAQGDYLAEQIAQAITGRNNHFSSNSEINPSQPLFESLKNVVDEKSLEQFESQDYNNDDFANIAGINTLSSQTIPKLNHHHPNVINPEIIQGLTGNINLLPLEPVQNDLINPKVVTSQVLFSEKNKIDSTNLNGNFLKNIPNLLQNIKINNLPLSLGQGNLINTANPFTPLRLNSGTRIYIMNSDDLIKSQRIPNIASTQQNQFTFLPTSTKGSLRLGSRDDFSISDISSYSTIDQ